MPYFKTTSLRWWLLIILANTLLTLWMVKAVPTLDYDAILYITAAKAIANNDWQLSSELYRGSLYPYLIYLSQRVSGLSYEASAHALNTIFFSLISFGFIATVKQLGGKSKTIFYISFTLILFFPSLLKYRPDVFREFGFLACYFWSIYYLLIFSQTKERIYLFFWFSLLSVGVFFRMESIAFLLGISSIILFGLVYKKLITINKQSLSKLILLFIGFLILIYVGLKELAGNYLIESAINYPIEYVNKAVSLLNEKLLVNSDGVIGVLKAIFEPIGSVLYIILKRLEIIYALLVIVAYKMRLVLTEQYQKKVILYYIVISFVTLVLFQMSLGYMTSRYALIFVLTVLLLVPFVIEKAVFLILEGKPFQKIGICLLLITLCFLSVKRLGVSDRNIEINAGLWIVDNVSEESVVASNNSKVLYYAKRFPYLSFKEKGTYYRFSTKLMLKDRNRKEFELAEYIVFMIRPDNEIDLNNEKNFTRLHGEPLKRIEQIDNDVYVNIYKTR